MQDICAFYKGKSSVLYPCRKEGYGYVVEFTRCIYQSLSWKAGVQIVFTLRYPTPRGEWESLLSSEDAVTCSVWAAPSVYNLCQELPWISEAAETFTSTKMNKNLITNPSSYSFLSSSYSWCPWVKGHETKISVIVGISLPHQFRAHLEPLQCCFSQEYQTFSVPTWDKARGVPQQQVIRKFRARTLASRGHREGELRTDADSQIQEVVLINEVCWGT